MAQLDFSFNTGTLTLNEIRNAFAAEYGYQDTIPNPNAGQEGQPATIPNPQTKAQFTRRKIKEHILIVVEGQRVKAAAAAALAATQKPTFDPADTD